MTTGKRLLPAVMLAAVGCASDPPQRMIEIQPGAPVRVVEPRRNVAPAPRGGALLRETMLAGHNRARGQVGAAPIGWSEPLARDAARYAAEMARTRRFAHSPSPRGKPQQGENLWMGSRDAYRYDEMLGHWVAERRHYKPRPAPGFSRTGRWQDVAHYTQIIWRRTTLVGCALARGAAEDYLVCRYLPVGNVAGETP